MSASSPRRATFRRTWLSALRAQNLNHTARRVSFSLALLRLTLLAASSAPAQDSFEIQVYPSDTVPRGQSMVELHSNYTLEGSKTEMNGVLPTHHALHETLEITQGFTPWFETGFYVLSSVQPGKGWEWAGDRLRPRLRVPESWRWPVGLSLSTEVAYERRWFSAEKWSWEIRPIIDKTIGRFYFSLNPTFERALDGPNAARGFEFSPSAKISYDVTRKVAAGVEYYSDLGRLHGFEAFGEQQQQIMPAIDLNLSPKWECNFGVGVGLNHSTDHLLIKLIVGRKF